MTWKSWLGYPQGMTGTQLRELLALFAAEAYTCAMKTVACCTLLFVSLVASDALAQNAAATWDGKPAPAPGAAAYPPYRGGYAYPGSYGISPQTMLMYENEKRNPLVSLVIEWFVPGVGSIYADHISGAITTWGLMVGGVVAIVWAVDNAHVQQQSGSTHIDTTPLVIGICAVLAGRIYGLADAYSSTGDYNRALARRLGLPDGVALGVVPITTGQHMAYGPALSLRF